MRHLIVGSALGFIALTGVVIKATASPNAGFHLNVGAIQDTFHAHLVEYVGDCPGKFWSGLAVDGDLRFISRQTEPQKKLKVRLTNLRTGKAIDRDYKKADKGSNDFNLPQLGHEDGKHDIEYQIYHKDTEEILESGNLTYTVTSSQETKQRNGNWKLELFCASNSLTPIEQCDLIGQREVKYCQGYKTRDVRNETIVRREPRYIPIPVYFP
jgi:hypothetical protein